METAARQSGSCGPACEGGQREPEAVLITGASTGLGQACALRLDGMGFGVFATVRRESDARRLRTNASRRLRTVTLDVTDPEAIKDTAHQLAEAAGQRGLWGLINNAGIAVVGPMECVPPEDFRRQMEVNVLGQVGVMQAAIPLLRRAGGRIVNMSSISGRVALPMAGPYAASKFALEAISDSMRLELRAHGVSVSVIEPGSAATPIWDKIESEVERMMNSLTPEALEQYGAAIAAVRQRMMESARSAIGVEVVMDAVIRALTARRPKARYVVGRSAKTTALLKRLFPDQAFDAILLRSIGLREPGTGEGRR